MDGGERGNKRTRRRRRERQNERKEEVGEEMLKIETNHVRDSHESDDVNIDVYVRFFVPLATRLSKQCMYVMPCIFHSVNRFVKFVK